MKRTLALAGSLLGAFGLIGSGQATDEQPDAELLEFLGSWEDPAAWQEFFDIAATTPATDESPKPASSGGTSNGE